MRQIAAKHLCKMKYRNRPDRNRVANVLLTKLKKRSMNNGLFRKEVAEARRTDWLGTVQLSPPKVGWQLLIAGSIVVSAVIAALCLLEYSRTEQVGGILVAREGVANLAAPHDGNISRVFVKEGSKVSAGDPLVELTSELDSMTLGSTRESISRELRTQERILKQDFEAQDAHLSAKSQELREKALFVNQQLHLLRAQILLQHRRVAGLKELNGRLIAIKDTGYVSGVQLNQNSDNLMQQELSLAELERVRIGLFQQGLEIEGAQRSVELETGEKKNDLSRRLADVAAALLENESRREVVLRAQRDGIITGIRKHSGEHVAASQNILTIVPHEVDLVAELWLPTRAIGFVKVGDQVSIRYDAYPYQKFGLKKGRVIEIAKTAMQYEESPQATSPWTDLRYRVLVKLQEQTVNVYERPEPLRPGMVLEADIKVENRKLIGWIFDPIHLMLNGDRVREGGR